MVTGGRSRDRQIRHVVPAWLAKQRSCRAADDEVADVKPDRRAARAFAIEQFDDPSQRSALAVAGPQWHDRRSKI
jgi:hypothetical protein